MSFRPDNDPLSAALSWTLDLVDEAVIVLQAGGGFLVYNRAAIPFFGPSPTPKRFPQWERACGFHSGEQSGAAVRCKASELPWRRILRGEKTLDTTYLVQNKQHPSGIWVSVKGEAQLDAEGAVVAAAITVRDISVERGAVESNSVERNARAQQAEKMEAIGRLAGGIAHDFNNLLTVISGYGQMLQDALERDLPADKMRPYLDELLSAGTRAVSLTDQLLAFSRRKVTRPRLLDLRDQVQEAEPLLSGVLGEEIEVVLNQAQDPCHVQADPAQITQAILNLANHARQFMPKGGRFALRTSVGEEPPFGIAGSPYVLLEISESEVCIDEDVLAHLFEPFFTRKSHGQGTGLGLPTVYGIVKQLGGEIAATSDREDGTVFRIYLPAVDKSADKNEKAAEHRSPRGNLKGHETILLVEDDNVVRNLVRTMLESLGYRPLVADNGKIALDLFQQHRANINLLLTDVIMPQMSGRELAIKLRQSDPNLKILYMSGYTADEIAVQGLINVKPILLQKPFDAEALARRVREVLDSPVLPH